MRNKPMIRTLAALSTLGALLTGATALATSAVNTVYSVQIESGTQYATIVVNGGPHSSGRPSCHSTFNPNQWAFDISTNKGKAMLTMVQTALLSGKRIGVTGSGSCINVAATGTLNIEGISYISILAD